MKVLIISPTIGGIDVYVNALAKELSIIPDVKVDVKGGKKSEAAYDVAKNEWRSSSDVKQILSKVANRINFNKYDFVLFHYGKNDVEQYIPVLLNNKGNKLPKLVYFVHYLSWNLFSHYLSDKKTAKQVEKVTTNFFDKYIFFGSYAKAFLEEKYMHPFSGKVIFLPETHANESLSSKEVESFKALFHGKYLGKHKKVVYLPGFGSNYKDIDSVLKSLINIDQKFLLVIAGNGWIKRVGFVNKKIGKVQVRVVEKYLSSKEYKFLSSQSLFGVFPYRQPAEKDEHFQGSGTLPNYIYEGKATIVYNEGSLPEYIGKSGIVLKSGDVNALSEAISELLDNHKRKYYEKEAKKISYKFSIKQHAAAVYRYLKTISY